MELSEFPTIVFFDIELSLRFSYNVLYQFNIKTPYIIQNIYLFCNIPNFKHSNAMVEVLRAVKTRKDKEFIGWFGVDLVLVCNNSICIKSKSMNVCLPNFISNNR